MKKLSSNEVSLLFLLMLLSAPLGFSRSIVLGDYYYPRGGSRWIERSGKTEFKRGDTIVIQDSRVALGRGLIQGEIAYLLDDAFVNVVEVRNMVNEFVTQQVYGATPFGAAQSEGHAIAIQIFVRSGSIGAT
ncbi:MAG: hypothetical protein HYX74_02985, partial [Acidobacteria bacterium]|nr:hypothetical protein [Acidobacteriota bacterium]